MKMMITAMTFNLSWAVQKNIVAGTEADFVEACQKDAIKCFRNSIKALFV